MDKSHCAHCGKELDAGTRFCIHCGAEQPPSPDSPSSAQQSVPPPAPGHYAPVQTSAVPAPKKRWPLFAGLGAAVVVVAAAVLLLTGVIKLGGGAPAFAATDINGEWSGTVTLDAVSGSGNQAEELKSQIGDTDDMDFEITLEQNGKGTATSSGQSMAAELSGSTLTINGQFYGGAFNSTGDIKKDGSSYSMSGNYSATMSGVTISGKITLQRSSSRTTATPAPTVAVITPMATAPPTETVTAEPAYSTSQPTMESTSTATLEGTYQYMYDEDNSYAMGIEFQSNGTCVLYDTADESRIPSAYVISGNTLNLTLYPVGEETRYQTYTIAVGTGRITLTDSDGSYDFVQVE